MPPSASQIASVHQNFIGLLLKYDITPLWKIFLQNIVDVNGGSVFINPELRYAAFSWLELAAGAQLPLGKRGGEFTPVPNLYSFQTQFFF